jgi:Glycosyltransferase family 87
MGALLLAPFAAVALAVALTPGPVFDGVTGDLRGYFQDSGRLLGGAVPYRDFPLEYPPFALLPMTLPRLVWPFGEPSDGALVLGFAAMEGVLAVLVGRLIERVSVDSVRAVATWALVVLLAAGSIAWRYDLWPATAVLLAFIATERGRPGLAGAAIGVGTMLKLFPVVVLPILAVRAIAMRDWGGLRRTILGAAVVAGLVMGATYLAAGMDSFGWLTYELDRGLQLESTGSGILLLLHVFAGRPFDLVIDFGTLQVVAPGADAIVAATPYLEMVLVGAVGALSLVGFRREVVRHGRVSATSLAIAIVAAIVALVVSSKVFSVQYVVWFLPLIPFLPARLRWLGLAIAGLSTLIYPLNYLALWHLDPVLAVVLNMRNALLIVFVVALVARLLRPSAGESRLAP